MNIKKKGIGDLMEKHRYRPSHLQKSLLEHEIPGRWEGKNGLQNVYNLINGNVVPRDSYVFIFLSKFLDSSLTEVLLRFTTKVEDTVRHQGNIIDW
jgi:hypothetical protein